MIKEPFAKTLIRGWVDKSSTEGKAIESLCLNCLQLVAVKDFADRVVWKTCGYDNLMSQLRPY